VGPLERAYYPHISQEKFEGMVDVGALQRVFYNDEVTIYKVSR
jgi:hypothetical protein